VILKDVIEEDQGFPIHYPAWNKTPQV